ncbi:nucleoporin [Moniliophthora roreri MCA 2997]|uniref:Nucleoporin n=1 Tax=Moniliophthora roreri (strain MCA 2997) TaxID=1381753 RepID=V2YDZ3_MONRO|nr:nucleoporin [Moniliophthora roreri MCA 2997]
METISRLRAVLINALDNRGSQYAEQEVFDELIIHKPRLVKVFDVGIRDVEQQKEIESGKTVINGKKVAINSDFARQVIFLSQQLECSERYVAGLLHSVMSENPNLDPVRCIELTVSEFHQRRRDLADCLRYLFQATEMAEYEDASPLFQHIGHFARTEILPPERQAGGVIPIAYRIFREIENLGNVLSRADAARKNARSDTFIPPVGQGSPSLGADILNARYDSLKYERRTLATSLYILARLGWCSPNEVKVIVEWLQANPNHSMSYYMLTAILAAFDPVDPQSQSGKYRSLLANDQGNLTFMTQKLSPTSQWREQGLKATILLKWTLFLAAHRHNNPQLENRDGFRTEELENQIWNAVQGDLFTYLGVAVLQLQRRYGGFNIPSLMVNLVPSTEQQEHREVPSDDFRMPILTAFETLIRLLITHASSELRKIKQRQEDLVLADARDRSRAPNRFGGSVTQEGERTPPRNDIALLYSFIGLLYSSLPEESALQFWGAGPQAETPPTYLELLETSAGRLPAFLQWAVWSTQAHDATMTMALFDMLAGLAKGQHCSELAYNFMARGGGEVIPGSSLPNAGNGSAVSWDVIFGLLDAWASNATVRTAPNHSLSQSGVNQSTYQHQSQHHPELTIGPKDVLLAQSFLRLMSAVVTHSVAVRVAISGHTQFRAIPTLVSLIPLSVPLELKGMLFETLSAFCQPGAGIPGLEICRAVWTLMEKLEVINVRPLPSAGYTMTVRPGKGVEVELDEIEGHHGLYPATIPFLKLLSTLIHTPKRIPLKDRVTEVVPINTIPDALGQPYRLPGIGPFTSFVVDHVFSKIHNRDFLRPSERWQMNDLCLCFIERALASYDLESFLAAAESGELKHNVITPYLIHPGYDILQRLLTNTTTSLQTTIISYVVEGLEGFDKGLAKEEPYFESTIVRVLRIVLRVLEIQDIFLDVLIPTLSDFDSTPLVGTIRPRSFFTRLDQALSFVPQHVPALAAYVAYPTHFEVVFLSVKILTILSKSTAFTNLATSIDRSDESDRILMGYVQALETETSEDVTAAETTAEQVTGAGAPDVDEPPTPLEQAIRLAVLDLLIQNTESNRSYPNFAHFLLFGSTNSEQGIQDPHALGARRTCVHVILQLLSIGIPTLKGKGRGHELSSTPLFALLPALAERCYHVIHQLCVHPRTSAFTMRYLRTREDFFARHLAAIPSQVPERPEEPPYIQVQYQDGARVTTTTATLNAFLRLRSWIFNLVALDLHVLTNKGQHGAVAELLDILFGNDSSIEEANIWEDEMSRPFREVGQSHLRIIEFVQSLTFDWSDTLEVRPVELQLLGQLNLLSCVRRDSSGCDVIDRTELLSLLTTARRSLFAQNSIVTPAQAEQLNLETNYILESCAVENHRRQVIHATSTGFEAWRRLLDTTLTKCFDRLPHDHRENMLFDILHVLPPIINSGNVHDSTAVLLSEVILSSITKLREDRRHQIILQSASGDPDSGALPAERLYAILRSMLECILNNSGVELVRGNLYASFINYIYLISSSTDLPSLHNDSKLALAWSSKREDSPFGDSMAIVPHRSQGRSKQGGIHLIQTNSLNLMQSSLERLVVIISRDAIDGTEVWRTVAFMLLDSLVQLSALDKNHPVPLHLVRHGILSNFVQGLSESDFLLQSVLKPDPDDLNPLYVYEAKMSLFIRMAQTRLGAERLLETRLIPALAQCDYLDARPEADSSFVDRDTFLPSAVQRYHQLFMPSLQLVNALLATLSAKHATASNQVLDFLSRHSATIVILLKNETDDPSLALLEEVNLIVSLCAQVLPLVTPSELVSTHSGFGAINSAILSLSTKCLAGGPWMEQIKPQTDAEMTDANSLATGFGLETKFEANVRRTEKTLRKALVTYAGATSDFTEPEISPVLSPICTLSRHEEKGHFLATIPTIGDALEALSTLCDDLAGTLRQISDISAELGAKALISVDNIRDIVADIDIDFIQDLEIDQKRALICRELERIGQAAKGDARLSINTIEMLLLLLWRHVGFYADDQNPKNPNANTFAASAMRFLATPDPESLRQDIGKRLGPILQRLQSLIVDDESLAEEWQANQAYVEIMCRRIRDCAGLHDSEQVADDSS